MPYSSASYGGTGTNQTFSVPFPYLSRSHVEVRVDGTPRAFTWDNGSTIRIAPAPPAGAVVELRRNTTKNGLLSDFQDGSVLTESALDLNSLQALYNTQEALDRAEALVSEAVAQAVLAAGTVNRSVPASTVSDVGRVLTVQSGGGYGWQEAPVTAASLASALASKADVSALASKADVSALASKADVSALASKADVSALAGKVNVPQASDTVVLFATSGNAVSLPSAPAGSLWIYFIRLVNTLNNSMIGMWAGRATAGSQVGGQNPGLYWEGWALRVS